MPRAQPTVHELQAPPIRVSEDHAVARGLFPRPAFAAVSNQVNGAVAAGPAPLRTYFSGPITLNGPITLMATVRFRSCQLRSRPGCGCRRRAFAGSRRHAL